MLCVSTPHSWGGATQVYVSFSSYLAFLTCGACLELGFYIRQWRNSRDWHLICPPTLSYPLLGHAPSPLWSGGVFFVPLGGSQRGLRRSTYVVWCVIASPRSRVRPGLALRPNSSSRRQVPGPHRPSRRHFLWPGVSGTTLHPVRSALQEATDLLPQ